MAISSVSPLALCFLVLGVTLIAPPVSMNKAHAASTEITLDKDPCRTRDNMRLQIQAVDNNLANIDTTRTQKGGPYLRQELICKAQYCVVISKSDFVWKHVPQHPDANEEGQVRYPRIDIGHELLLKKDAKQKLAVADRACQRLAKSRSVPKQTP